ncbi:MAG: DUF898 domain-containing protein [Minwuiales bacterium]|nr:DUF898 domain-containing protein [Minwuiales bacterium]
MSIDVAAAQPRPVAAMPYVHHGAVGEVFLIFLRNLALNILTFGFYRFWARTRLRHYFWSQSEMFGDRFEYDGRGLELFLGFLFIAFIVLLPIGATYNVIATFASTDEVTQIWLSVVGYIGFFTLIGIATYRARGYRLSRTRWRGIRLFQVGNEFVYGPMFLLLFTLQLVTLGWATPFANTWLERYRIRHTYLGSERFSFDGRARHLYGRFAVGWLLALFTFGLGYFFYKAREIAYFAERTHVAGISFRFQVSALRLCGFWLLNMLILIVTLSLGYPFVQLRTARFVSEHLSIVGEPGFANIQQVPADMPVLGEGLADAFDMDGM